MEWIHKARVTDECGDVAIRVRNFLGPLIAGNFSARWRTLSSQRRRLQQYVVYIYLVCFFYYFSTCK